MFGEDILGYYSNSLMNSPEGCFCETQDSPYTLYYSTTIAANSDGTSPLTNTKDTFTCTEMEVYKVISD